MVAVCLAITSSHLREETYSEEEAIFSGATRAQQAQGGIYLEVEVALSMGLMVVMALR